MPERILKYSPGTDAGLEFYSTALVASDQFLAERPDVARRFINAFAKAINFTWKNPEASGVAINKQVPEVDSQVAADTIKAIKGLVYNDASASHGLGKFDPERLATTWSWTAPGATGWILPALTPHLPCPQTALTESKPCDTV